MARDLLHNVTTAHHDKVLIVDFGSQVTQLIARRVREAGIYCAIATAAFNSESPGPMTLRISPHGTHKWMLAMSFGAVWMTRGASSMILLIGVVAPC
jgi:hypothetical protein